MVEGGIGKGLETYSAGSSEGTGSSARRRAAEGQKVRMELWGTLGKEQEEPQDGSQNVS